MADQREGNMNMRAKKAGIAYQIQKKMEDGYDQQEELGTPRRCMEWINEILGTDHPTCADFKWRTIHFHLKDGVAINKVINKLRTAGGMSTVKFSKNAQTPFVAMENIETFNKAAAQYGLPDSDLFQSVDLYEGNRGPLLNVINCIHRLGTKANEKGFTIRYNAVEAPKCAY